LGVREDIVGGFEMVGKHMQFRRDIQTRDGASILAARYCFASGRNSKLPRDQIHQTGIGLKSSTLKDEFPYTSFFLSVSHDMVLMTRLGLSLTPEKERAVMKR
jgi:hypothetical protein